ncbi:hypothetical protein Saso_38410 [Streptomyces asoensis]|uniref:Uncharacterized protein n=1 Tax=Streptomyces asoensis TaxID=249586 RepID=A0ABQ3S258_9ACTN|nr:hypothetical protein GCM10010496_41570 [Streptomyces asoensis]GHI62191.1 hypothetical protein Saso_38410 [Streptomyces asoensis]
MEYGFDDRSAPDRRPGPPRAVFRGSSRAGGLRGGCSVADGDRNNTARTAGRNDGED